MAQVNGSHFKLVYETLDHANGHESAPCFIKGNLYRKFKQKYPNEIISKDQIYDDNFIYLFPIEISDGTVDALTSSDFIKNISDDVMAYMKSGKLKIVTNLIHDPVDGSLPGLKKFEIAMNNIGVASNNINFIFGNKCDHSHSLAINLYTGSQLLVQQADELNSYPYFERGYHSDCVRKSDLDKNIIRAKKFLSPNNMMKHHRVTLAYLIMKYNLLNDGLYSFLEKISVEEIKSKVLQTYTDDETTLNFISDKIAQMLPYELDTKGLTHAEKVNIVGLPGNVKSWYTDSYLHLVTETMFNDSTDVFLSEKVFRPIINLQPFLIFGQPKSLEKLKQLGFKTFSPIIDETYDLETNYKKRILLIEKEILKFSKMSIEEIHHCYYSVVDILLYNQQRLSSFANHDYFESPLEEIFNFYKNNE